MLTDDDEVDAFMIIKHREFFEVIEVIMIVNIKLDSTLVLSYNILGTQVGKYSYS